MVGECPHLLIGAILDGVSDVDGVGIDTECSGLCSGRFTEHFGRYEYPGNAPAFEIGDVVHTARRTTASIRERLDHGLTIAGDFVT